MSGLKYSIAIKTAKIRQNLTTEFPESREIITHKVCVLGRIHVSEVLPAFNHPSVGM